MIIETDIMIENEKSVSVSDQLPCMCCNNYSIMYYFLLQVVSKVMV